MLAVIIHKKTFFIKFDNENGGNRWLIYKINIVHNVINGHMFNIKFVYW